MSVAVLSRLDLSAYALAREWGVNLTPNTILRPASPCFRRHCGGSVLGDGCMLCARAHGRDSAADLARAALAGNDANGRVKARMRH